MTHATTDELQRALRPIASLISKSEKAQQKLVPGTWQHAMLGENLKSLHLAAALMSRGSNGTEHFKRDDLQAARRALSSMMDKTEKAKARFSAGTSQHSLQRNRLTALRLAESLVNEALAEW